MIDRSCGSFSPDIQTSQGDICSLFPFNTAEYPAPLTLTQNVERATMYGMEAISQEHNK